MQNGLGAAEAQRVFDWEKYESTKQIQLTKLHRMIKNWSEQQKKLRYVMQYSKGMKYLSFFLYNQLT
jgi:hypothetical protein